MRYLPPTRHVNLLATLRQERRLPFAGDVVVRAGERVSATDVVAQADVADNHLLKDVARELGVPREKVAMYIVKEEGEMVEKGEAIAIRKTFLGQQTVTSPVRGRVAIVAEGRVLLVGLSPFQLRAGVPGEVVNVVENHGVVIELTGAILDGAWGNGREDTSVLRLLADSANGVLQPAQLDLALRGVIVAAARVEDAGMFGKLQEIGVRGLILASATAEQIATLKNLAFPVMVSEGFGVHGLCEPAFQILKTGNTREVWLNAQATDLRRNQRPHLIVPVPGASSQPPAMPLDGELLKEGKRVRVVRGPDFGRLGIVIGLSERAMPLPNGVRSHVAAVTLDEMRGSRPTVSVPFANLELLE